MFNVEVADDNVDDPFDDDDEGPLVTVTAVLYSTCFHPSGILTKLGNSSFLPAPRAHLPVAAAACGPPALSSLSLLEGVPLEGELEEEVTTPRRERRDLRLDVVGVKIAWRKMERRVGPQAARMPICTSRRFQRDRPVRVTLLTEEGGVSTSLGV